MKCINCNKEMKNKSYSFWSMADWDSENSSGWHEEYYCKDCEITYINDKWEIPFWYEKATQKQIRAVNFINKYCNTNYNPILKYPCISFIKEFLPIAQENYQIHLKELGEWYKEEFGELDYY